MNGLVSSLQIDINSTGRCERGILSVIIDAHYSGIFLVWVKLSFTHCHH